MLNIAPLQQKSTLERKLLFAGFIDVQATETKAFLPLEGARSLTVCRFWNPDWFPFYHFICGHIHLVLNNNVILGCNQIKGKKASWTGGSAFPIKKVAQAVPKIQLDDESELIDEDSLLTEEDLKKPQLPVGKICYSCYTVHCCATCVPTCVLIWVPQPYLEWKTGGIWKLLNNVAKKSLQITLEFVWVLEWILKRGPDSKLYRFFYLIAVSKDLIVA